MKLRTEKWIGWALLTVGLTALVLTLVMVQPGPVAGAGATSRLDLLDRPCFLGDSPQVRVPASTATSSEFPAQVPRFVPRLATRSNGRTNQPIYQTLMEAWNGVSVGQSSLVPTQPPWRTGRPECMHWTELLRGRGYFSSYVGTLNLVEIADGHRAVTPVPNPANTPHSLVFPYQPNRLHWVGNYNDPNGPSHSFVEAWDEAHASVVPVRIPLPASTSSPRVSCTSPTSCMAAGSSSKTPSGGFVHSLVDPGTGATGSSPHSRPWRSVAPPRRCSCTSGPTSAWRSAPLDSPVSNRPCRSAVLDGTPGP